jgi:hypothetical protein
LQSGIVRAWQREKADAESTKRSERTV